MTGNIPIDIFTRAVSNAGGAGTMFQETPTAQINVGWGVMYGITAILGAWGAGTLGQSDWTRYANRRLAPTLSQLVAAPVTITVTAVIGIIVTSAAKDLLGEVVWNPIYLLADIQNMYDSSPRARAGVFFASVGMVSTQLAVRTCPSSTRGNMLTGVKISVVLNSVSIGMDMAGLCPKYINIRRGSYIMAIIGICTQ
jgi:NCS1 family nucleobase:cation symporter-1